MVEALWRHWAGRYAVLTQVPTIDTDDEASARLGFAVGKYRRIDLLVIARNRQGKVPWARTAVEIKVSRADFLAEQRDPGKRAAWQALAHRFTYAVPAGLVSPDEVPDGCGLVEVARHGPDPSHPYWDVTWRRKAPLANPAAELPDWFWPYVAGRAGRGEATLAGRGVDTLTREDPALLAHDLRKARAAVERLTETAAREKERRVAATRLALGATPQTCAFCGTPVRLTTSRYSVMEWVHRSRGTECDTSTATARVVQVVTEALPADVLAAGVGWMAHHGARALADLAPDPVVLPTTMLDDWIEDTAAHLRTDIEQRAEWARDDRERPTG